MALILCKKAFTEARRAYEKGGRTRVVVADGCVEVTKQGRRKIGRIRLVVRKDIPK